jgi:hypothetical protein
MSFWGGEEEGRVYHINLRITRKIAMRDLLS